MNLKMINEAFKRKYSNTLNEAQEVQESAIVTELRNALLKASMNVSLSCGGIVDLRSSKQLEIAFQDVIESIFPDSCWWEVTDCEIFLSIFNLAQDPSLKFAQISKAVIDNIISSLKPEFAGKSEAATESLEEDTNNENKDIIYSKNGVEVEHKAGNYFTVTRNGVQDKGFYVNDNGKDEEQIKQRARDKVAMGDFKDDPGTNDVDESLITEDVLVEAGRSSLTAKFFKPFDTNNKRVEHVSEEYLIELVKKAKSQGYDLADVYDIRYNHLDPKEFDPDYDAEAVKLCYKSNGEYTNMTAFYHFKETNLKVSPRNGYNRNVGSVISNNPVAIRAALHAIQDQGPLTITEIKICGVNGKPMDFDTFNKLADAILKCKYKDAAITGAKEKVEDLDYKLNNEYLTKPITQADPNAQSKNKDNSKPLNVFNDQGVVSNRPLNAGLIRQLEACLTRLNEAVMSPEDERDSAIIKGMADKLKKRSNARFNPEEQAMMTKYGFTRDNWAKRLRVGDRELNPSYDGKERKVYNGYGDWKGHYVRNGDPEKINYADRARKLKDRQFSGDTQVSGRYTPNGEINAHTRQSGYTLQDVERAAAEDRDRKPVDDMKRHLRDRDYYQNQIDGAQAEYDKSVGDARKKYDDSVRWATDTYRRHTVDAEQRKKRSDDEIDKMLRRK